MAPITSFQGTYRFLSNFWPCYITHEGILYPTTEHAYQAAKTSDIHIRERIRDCSTPAEAKEFFLTHQIQPDTGWTEDRKLKVMETLLTLKFAGTEPLLTRALLDTGPSDLIEGNTWNDTFWGVCNGTGKNHLGRILMKVRSNLLKEKEEIIRRASLTQSNREIADAMSMSERKLYERMLGLSIPNAGYWIC